MVRVYFLYIFPGHQDPANVVITVITIITHRVFGPHDIYKCYVITVCRVIKLIKQRKDSVKISECSSLY